MFLGVVLFTALPKVYLHQLMGHDHTIKQVIDEGKTDNYKNSDNTPNCELSKFETPGYFTIFKVILKCTPFRKHAADVSYQHKQTNPQQEKINYHSLRGPPVV